MVVDVQTDRDPKIQLTNRDQKIQFTFLLNPYYSTIFSKSIRVGFAREKISQMVGIEGVKNLVTIKKSQKLFERLSIPL